VGSAELRASDLRAMLDLLGATHEASGPAEFGEILMSGLSGVVPCDLISYNEIDLVGGATQTYFEPALAPRPEVEEAFAQLIDEHPLVSEYAATRDPRPLRMSDFLSLSQLHGLELYHEVFRPLETNHQLAFSLAIEADVVIGIGLNRRVKDFSAREVAAMTELQPHLTAAFGHSLLRERWSRQRQRQREAAEILESLTARQQEVALLVADGHTNRQVAQALNISIRTVDNHVANLFRTLGLPSRVSLAARIRPPFPA
jgi:DNA-binding NarL/FixJ family response regulator